MISKYNYFKMLISYEELSDLFGIGTNTGLLRAVVDTIQGSIGRHTNDSQFQQMADPRDYRHSRRWYGVDPMDSSTRGQPPAH
jgi:hypothetical protein